MRFERIVRIQTGTGGRDVVLTHEGGDSIPRDTLGIYGDALNDTITDLGDGTDERIMQPFDGPVVSQNDTLVINSDSLNEGTVLLLWKKPDSTMSTGSGGRKPSSGL